MIDFSNVRIEKEKTYTFFNGGACDRIRWCFEQAGITDYELYGSRRFKEYVPANVPIPEVKLSPGSEYNDPRPIVIISHMNTDDLLEKLYQIKFPTDPDVLNYIDTYMIKPGEDYEKRFGKLPD